MSATVTIHRRPGELDRLSEAVLASLSRPVSKPLYRGSLWVIFLTALTLGLWPLWKSIGWMRDFAAVREQRCWHFAEWFRTTENDPAAEKLQYEASRIRPNFFLAGLIRIALLIALATLLFSVRYHQPLYRSNFQAPQSQSQLIFSLALITASLGVFFQLLEQQDRFARFLKILNPLLARYELPPIKDARQFSFNLVDWIGGVALASQGAAWPLFTIISIGLFRSYVRRSLRVHAQIGDRVRDLLKFTAPPLRLPQRSDLLDRCPRPECGAILENEAKFCARCGIEVSPKG